MMALLLSSVSASAITAGAPPVAGHRYWRLKGYDEGSFNGGALANIEFRAAVSGPTGIQHYLRIGAVNYDGPTHLTPSLGDTLITEWATNPATALPWASADLATLIAGVESIA